MKVLFYTICCFILSFTAFSQDSIPKSGSKEWHLLLEPYILFPSMSGRIGLGALPEADVHANIGDIFDHLVFGAMFYGEVYSHKWVFSSDLLFMHLRENAKVTDTVNSGRVDAKQLGWEVAAMRRICKHFDAGLALTLDDIKNEATLNVNTPAGATNVERKITKTWIDPSIVARYTYSFTHKLSVAVKGNIGGFSIGSRLFWQAQGYVYYRFSKLFQLSAGYRYISIDYEHGDGSDRFLYDVDTFGPVIRAGFHVF